jgi:hypothetical protein
MPALTCLLTLGLVPTNPQSWSSKVLHKKGGVWIVYLLKICLLNKQC